MLLLRLWNYIRGYVIIHVEGYFLEKFINICTHRQLFLWDIKRCNNTSLTMKMSIRGFKSLRPITKKTGCRVKIISKRGLPFIFNRYRRRKAFIAGAIFFVVIIYFSTSFIWEIEVSGNKSLETQVILEKLSFAGVKPGVVKYRIDPDNVVNRMMHDVEELSWISVSIKGTKVKVVVAERSKIPQLLNINEACDIVAMKDGTIKNIVVKNGVGIQKVGDTVAAGQLLISGTIPIKGSEEQFKLVHAMGFIIARTWYEENTEVKLNTIERTRTGRYIDNVYISLIIKKFNLLKKEIKYENYDKIEIKKRVKIGEDMVFPFEYVIERFYEVENIYKELELNEAKNFAALESRKKLLERIPDDANIVNTDLNYIESDDGKIVARIIVECEEEIGLKKRIGGN
jgi:similar to stage IV sporulation protein